MILNGFAADCSASVREHLLARASDCFRNVLTGLLRLATGEPTSHVRKTDQASAADLQRGQFPSGEYPVNCSAAEPQALSQMTYANQGALNIRLHVYFLSRSASPPILIRLENISRT